MVLNFSYSPSFNTPLLLLPLLAKTGLSGVAVPKGHSHCVALQEALLPLTSQEQCHLSSVSGSLSVL